jgi:VanZ family protein
MRTSLVITSLRVLTWCCVILLGVLSLLPAQQMVRTGLPGRLEHFVAYAGSAAIAVTGYGVSLVSMQIIGGFWVYAGILEYLQHFSPGRHPSIADFAASALGGCAAVLLSPSCGGACPSRAASAPDNRAVGLRHPHPFSFPGGGSCRGCAPPMT